MNLLIIIPAFLVTIGILVTVHEFGHFWVARKLGVKVLRFSVGFGKPLFRWTSPKDPDKTEYVLAALPLGGYVKMLDEREGDVPENERARSFNQQNVWTRIAIVFAGPAFNFMLAILIYAIVFSTGNPAMHPLVEAQAESPASSAGFKPGDKIIAINQQSVTSWEDTRILLLEHYLRSPLLNITVETQQQNRVERQLDLSDKALLKDEGDFLNESGLMFWSPEYGIALGQILPDGAAEQAGLKSGDKIQQVNGKRLERARDFVDYVKSKPGESLDFQVQRDEGIVQMTVIPAAREQDGKTVGFIGAGVGEYVPRHILEEQLAFTQRLGIFDSFIQGAEKTWQMSIVTLKLMGRMLTGDVSLKNISGPLTIAKFSGETAVAGFPYYMGFLAIVSISLGVLNLLPIPMLDGGHLLYYFIEIIKGSPVSEQVEEVGLRFGMTVIAGIMVLALYNDFMRFFN